MKDTEIIHDIITDVDKLKNGIYTKEIEKGIITINKQTKTNPRIEKLIEIELKNNDKEIYKIHKNSGIYSILYNIDDNVQKKLYIDFFFRNNVYIDILANEYKYTIKPNSSISKTINSEIKSETLYFYIYNDILKYKLNNRITLGYNMQTKTPLVYIKKYNSEQEVEIEYNEFFNEKISTYNVLLEHSINLIEKTVSEEFKEIFKSYKLETIDVITDEYFYELLEVASVYENSKKYFNNKDIISIFDDINIFINELINSKEEAKINALANYIKNNDIKDPKVLKKIKSDITSINIDRRIKKLTKHKNNEK